MAVIVYVNKESADITKIQDEITLEFSDHKYDFCPYKKTEKTPHEDRGKVATWLQTQSWSHRALSQRKPRIASNDRLRECGSVGSLDFRLLASVSVRASCFCFKLMGFRAGCPKM